MEKIRKHKLTIGLVLSLFGALTAVISVTYRSQSAVSQIAQTAIERHSVTSIDRAHPDLSTRYICREEHAKSLGKIESDVRSIREAMDRMQKDLERIASR